MKDDNMKPGVVILEGLKFESADNPIKGCDNTSPRMASAFLGLIRELLMQGGCITAVNADNFHTALRRLLRDYHGSIEVFADPTDEPGVIQLKFHATRRES